MLNMEGLLQYEAEDNRRRINSHWSGIKSNTSETVKGLVWSWMLDRRSLQRHPAASLTQCQQQEDEYSPTSKHPSPLWVDQKDAKLNLNKCNVSSFSCQQVGLIPAPHLKPRSLCWRHLVSVWDTLYDSEVTEGFSIWSYYFEPGSFQTDALYVPLWRNTFPWVKYENSDWCLLLLLSDQ